MTLTLAAFTTGTAITVIVLTIAVVALVVLAMRIVDQESGPEGSDGTDSGSDGRGGGDPAWWPEFERELDRYAARRDRDRSATGVSSRGVT